MTEHDTLSQPTIEAMGGGPENGSEAAATLAHSRWEHAWPESIDAPRGMAPGELRLIRKMTGAKLDELETEDQAQAAVFIALFRRFRDDDPELLWQKAEWVQLTPAEPPKVDPTKSGS